MEGLPVFFWGFEKKKCFNFLAALTIHLPYNKSTCSFVVTK